MIMAAIALVFGMAQCKKQEQPTQNGDNIVPITLDVRANSGAKIDVNTTNGAVKFEMGDVVYVASGQKFVGTLTHNGATFAGNLTNPTENEPLYFFFLGNKTPLEDLTAGTSTSCSVVISDQTSKLPVISFATSNETFTGAGLYTAYFLNKAALVKFDVTSASPNTTTTIIKGMNNKVTVDFATNGFGYSQVDEGRITLASGNGEQWAILLPQPALAEGESGTIYSGDKCYKGARPAMPLINANDWLTDGIALTVGTTASPTGAITGLFTINENGDQVWISQGNLKYSAGTWSFHTNQYDRCFTNSDEYFSVADYYNENGTFDLFGWGTSGYNGRVPYLTTVDVSSYLDGTNSISGTNYDWGKYNPIENGGNTAGQWRTLTYEEWRYIYQFRSDASSKCAVGNVAGVNGAIFLPDDWTLPAGVSFTSGWGNGYSTNNYTSGQWALMQANGAIFLPVAGFRHGTTACTTVYWNNLEGAYWSSSHATTLFDDEEDGALETRIVNSGLAPWSPKKVRYGCSVRLVQDAE